MESQGHRNSKKKKAELLKLSDLNTNSSIAVIKANVDWTRAPER